MPCYQVNLLNVEFVINEPLLIKALTELGLSHYVGEEYIECGRIIFQNGKITFPDYASDKVNQIKRKYSEKVVEEIAKKKKWILKRQGNKITLKKY